MDDHGMHVNLLKRALMPAHLSFACRRLGRGGEHLAAVRAAKEQQAPYRNASLPAAIGGRAY